MSGPTSWLPSEEAVWVVGVVASIAFVAIGVIGAVLLRRGLTREVPRWTIKTDTYEIKGYDTRVEITSVDDPTRQLFHGVDMYFPWAAVTPAQPVDSETYESRIDLRRTVTPRDMKTLAFILSRVTST